MEKPDSIPAHPTNTGAGAGAPGLDSETWDGFQHTQTEIRGKDTQLIQIVDAALADATLRASAHLACRPGCTQCCHGAFAISPLDALRLRDAMAEMSIQNPQKAEQIRRRALQYLSEFAPEFPGNRETGILGTTPEAQAAFEDFASEAACPALDPVTGLCEVYAARPMTCRIFGPPVQMSEENVDSDSEATAGLAVCELCFTEATPEEIAAAEMTVPWAEEQAILEQLAELNSTSSAEDQPREDQPRETIVAYCLTLPPLQTPS